MRAVILILDKTDLKSRSIMKDKEEHLKKKEEHLIIKGSIHQKDKNYTFILISHLKNVKLTPHNHMKSCKKDKIQHLP